MSEFLLQPAIFQTGHCTELFQVLDSLWPKNPSPSEHTYYLISGFGSFNGGVSFIERFRSHVEQGGRVRAVFAGSTSSNVTSLQLAHALLESGAEVHLINRRYMMHAKLYGKKDVTGNQRLIVSSGNFTAPGIARNVESVLSLDEPMTASLNFQWDDLVDGLLRSGLEVFALNGADPNDPRWALLYDESKKSSRKPTPEDEEDVFESLVITLSHSDTARVMATAGENAGKGTQYFWLSKDSYAFFPPLTIRNDRGRKATYSCLINVNFQDIGRTDQSRVTYEAENNLDFRLGTASLRHTGLAEEGDIAVLTRRSEYDYELKIVKKGTPEFFSLSPYAATYIGAKGKRFGYAPNGPVDKILGRHKA